MKTAPPACARQTDLTDAARRFGAADLLFVLLLFGLPLLMWLDSGMDVAPPQARG